MDIWNRYIKQDKGSAVTVMMGGVAVLAMLSFGAYQLMSGPLTSMSKVTQNNLVKDSVMGIAAISVMDAAGLGDCDSDGFVEPREWRTTTGDAPVNGGLIPTDFGINVKDPWNIDYGYCVWDMGVQFDQAACGGAGANRLDGADTITGEYQTLTVMAIISAGPNRVFDTTCDDYTDTTTDVITNTGDDVIKRFSYGEASTATSSLWDLKVNDPETAEIEKNLDIGSDINFDYTTGAIDALALSTYDKMIADGGIKLADEGTVTSCTSMSVGTLRYHSTLKKIQYCNNDGTWHSSDEYSWPQFADIGSAAAPSYSFANSTGSGLYVDASENVVLISSTGKSVKVVGDNSSLTINDTAIDFTSNGTINVDTPNENKIDFSNGDTDFRLKSVGGIQIADTTATCDGTSIGAMKYVSADKQFEYCDGTGWQELGAAGSIPAATEKLVFVTSGTWDGNLGGISGSDAKCQSAATTAGLTGTFKAWVSDGTDSPSTTFTQASVSYKLVNGTTIADDWADLIDGTIQNAITIDENSATPGAPTSVWTGTNTDGSSNTDHCSMWASTAGSGLGGLMSATTSQWTNRTPLSCTVTARLYCFEQ